MKRIGNNFSWTTIEDWKAAQEMGLVEQCHIQNSGSKNLEHLADMALQGCFPLQAVCCCQGEKKYFVMDETMEVFWKFINNEIPMILDNGREQYFSDLSPEKQSKLLKSAINSVWIDIEAEPSKTGSRAECKQ